MSKGYNGYSNYATWRVQLEILDGIEYELERMINEDLKEQHEEH